MHPFFNPNANQAPQFQQPKGASSLTPQQVNPLQMAGGGVPNPQLNQFIPNQFLNVAQQFGQFMPQNNLNPNQLFNQNMNLGQWNLNNPMQNMNMGMNMNANPFLAMGLANLAQSIGPQNLAILASAQNQVPHMGLQAGGNLGNMQGIRPPQAQLNIQNYNQLAAQGLGPPQVQQNYNQALAQVNSVNVTTNNQNGNWNKPPNKYNQKPDSFQNRSAPFYHGQPGMGNFGPPKDKRGKGHQDEGPRKYISNPSKENQGEKKKPRMWFYTAREIKQWREQRRKNYPSRATLQKKLADEATASEARAEAAKLRRQQLKEVLAKQAELGCEIAEIPSSYLSDSEKPVYGEGLKRPFNKRERFQNKFNKRGRFQRNGKFSRRRESGNCDPSDESQQRDQFNQKRIRGNNRPTRQDGASKKEPTLLQKLLSADIKRENHQLLQVFRFIVTNSFFKDFPEKDLKFPYVIVKDEDYESPVLDENAIIKAINVDGPNGSDDDVDDEGPRNPKEQEEEGEIVD